MWLEGPGSSCLAAGSSGTRQASRHGYGVASHHAGFATCSIAESVGAYNVLSTTEALTVGPMFIQGQRVGTGEPHRAPP
jgi:hypothetical protein